MGVHEVMAAVRKAGLELRVVDGKLTARGPQDAMTPELGQQLRDYKDALLDMLSYNLPTPGARVAASLASINEGAIAKAHENKSTVPGQKPPLQEVLELHAWLATVDWTKGLRCGRTRKQCLVCRGIPCHGSIEW